MHRIDAPEAFVDKTYGRLGSGIEGEFKGIALNAVEQLHFPGGLNETGFDGGP